MVHQGTRFQILVSILGVKNPLHLPCQGIYVLYDGLVLVPARGETPRSTFKLLPPGGHVFPKGSKYQYP